MESKFENLVCENVQSDISDVYLKLTKLRKDKNIKEYRNVSESLDRLVGIFMSNTDINDLKSNFIMKIPMKTMDFIKELIDALEEEFKLLAKESRNFLDDNNFHNHRDCVISYEKIIKIRKALSWMHDKVTGY